MNLTSRRTFLQASLATAASTTLLPAASSKSSSSKKGIASKAKHPKSKKILEELNPNWLYTWGTKKPQNLPQGIDFVPMIWGYWGKNDSIRKAAAKAKEQGITELLGFNEPDGKRQANMKVEKALRAWPVLMESGLRLGSPACVHPDNEWMKSFMAATKKQKLRVDFVCVHSYGNPNAKQFLDQMERVHRLYKKPIWITEFAIGDWNAKSPQTNKHKPEEILKFMDKVFPALEKLDYIEKYAWFPAQQNSKALGTSALYDSKANLTKLGKFYADFQA